MRTGNFSSSEIYKLMTNDRKGTGFGAPGLTYIAEKKMERRLGRPLNKESNDRYTNWGLLVEKRAFDLIGLEYQLVSQERVFHPDISYWCGAPDGVTDDSVIDIKSPFTLKSFCEQVDAMEQGVEAFKELKPEYYWQLVSGSILLKKPYAEIIVYVPYQDELGFIREMASNYDGDQNRVAFVNFAGDDELPYILRDGYYKNINKLRFEVPESDKKLLTGRVLLAGKELIGTADSNVGN